MTTKQAETSELELMRRSERCGDGSVQRLNPDTRRGATYTEASCHSAALHRETGSVLDRQLLVLHTADTVASLSSSAAVADDMRQVMRSSALQVKIPATLCVLIQSPLVISGKTNSFLCTPVSTVLALMTLFAFPTYYRYFC